MKHYAKAVILHVAALGFSYVFCANSENLGGHTVRLRRGSSDTSTSQLQSHEVQNKYGDPTCMTRTGRMCKFSPCNSERGPVTCVDDICICEPGFCADAQGHCQPGQQGGSVRFLNASRPRLSIQDRTIESDVVATVRDSQAQLRMADMHNAFMRFESARKPGKALKGIKIKNVRDGSIWLFLLIAVAICAAAAVVAYCCRGACAGTEESDVDA